MLGPSRGRLATSLWLQPDQQPCTGLQTPLRSDDQQPCTGLQLLLRSDDQQPCTGLQPPLRSNDQLRTPELHSDPSSSTALRAWRFSTPFYRVVGGIWSFTFDPLTPAGSAPFVILIRSCRLTRTWQRSPSQRGHVWNHSHCRGSITFVGGDVVRWGSPLLAKRWRCNGDDGEEMFVLK